MNCYKTTSAAAAYMPCGGQTPLIVAQLYTSLRHAERTHRSGFISSDVKRGQIFEAEAEDNFLSP